MEVNIDMPQDQELQRQLMFDTRFFDVDQLIGSLKRGILPFDELNHVSAMIQQSIQTTPTIERYALDLCGATRNPSEFWYQHRRR